MEASEDRRTGEETTGARTGRFVYGFSDDLGAEDARRRWPRST